MRDNEKVCPTIPSSQKFMHRLLSRLPTANYQLLRHLLCVLHEIVRNEAHNQMNSQNVAVCIAHSMLDMPPGAVQEQSVKHIPLLVQYLIEK